MYVSSTNVCFRGKIGFQNLVSSLNQIAAQYTNSKYTIALRYMGYNGQTCTITDISKLDSSTVPWMLSTSSEMTLGYEVVGGGDVGYEKDYNLVKNIYETLDASKIGTTTQVDYWLASRTYNYSSSTRWYYSSRNINSSGNLRSYGLYGYMNSSVFSGVGKCFYSSNHNY